jgi:hypothetical protein
MQRLSNFRGGQCRSWLRSLLVPAVTRIVRPAAGNSAAEPSLRKVKTTGILAKFRTETQDGLQHEGD